MSKCTSAGLNHTTLKNGFYGKAYAQDYDIIDYLSVSPFGYKIYCGQYDEEGSQCTFQIKHKVTLVSVINNYEIAAKMLSKSRMYNSFHTAPSVAIIISCNLVQKYI